MNNWTRATLAALISGFSIAAVAQDLQCPDITKTLKEYSIDASSSSYLSAVFSEHCQQDGSRKTSSGSLGFETIVKSIPLKFTGGASSNRDAHTNFCKIYSDYSSTQSAEDKYKETISAKALETIAACNELQAKGVYITHTILDETQANFYLRGNVTQQFELGGVSVSDNVTCKGIVDGKPTTVGPDLGQKIASTLSFACTRQGRPTSPDGQLTYDQGSVQVLTNQGNYAVFWPRDLRQTENMASAIDRRITELAGDVAVTKASVAPLVTASSLAVYMCPTGATTSRDAPWMYVGCNGQISTEKRCTNVWYNAGTEERECKPLGNLRLFN